jgi:uncharacterized protein (DUF305 family)
MKYRPAALGTALVLCLASGGLAGCTGGDDRPSAAAPSGSVIVPGRPGEPNKTVPATRGTVTPPGAADIRFVQMMVPHHEQALEMAALAPGQAANAKVKALADRIDAAQTAEISAMQSWLRRHARQAQGGHDGGGHGAGPAAPMQMPGMATPQQMAQLKAATGANFDRLFLTLMITHHQGALTMANEELVKGTDVLIREMAQEVIVTQAAEINRMRALLSP